MRRCGWVGIGDERVFSEGIERNLHGMREHSGRGHGVGLGDPIRVDDVVLDVAFSFAPVTSLLLHPETWLVERRRDVRALHPELIRPVDGWRRS